MTRCSIVAPSQKAEELALKIGTREPWVHCVVFSLVNNIILSVVFLTISNCKSEIFVILYII